MLRVETFLVIRSLDKIVSTALLWHSKVSDSFLLTLTLDFDFDAYMQDRILITANCFNQNSTEYNKFMNYKRTHNMSTNQLRDQLVQRYRQNPSILSVVPRVIGR